MSPWTSASTSKISASHQRSIRRLQRRQRRRKWRKTHNSLLTLRSSFKSRRRYRAWPPRTWIISTRRWADRNEILASRCSSMDHRSWATGRRAAPSLDQLWILLSCSSKWSYHRSSATRTSQMPSRSTRVCSPLLRSFPSFEPSVASMQLDRSERLAQVAPILCPRLEGLHDWARRIASWIRITRCSWAHSLASRIDREASSQRCHSGSSPCHRFRLDRECPLKCCNEVSTKRQIVYYRGARGSYHTISQFQSKRQKWHPLQLHNRILLRLQPLKFNRGREADRQVQKIRRNRMSQLQWIRNEQVSRAIRKP